ncbi:hypothetical protein MRX96_038565 [Rhipicephalus microplus]
MEAENKRTGLRPEEGHCATTAMTHGQAGLLLGHWNSPRRHEVGPPGVQASVGATEEKVSGKGQGTRRPKVSPGKSHRCVFKKQEGPH